MMHPGWPWLKRAPLLLALFSFCAPAQNVADVHIEGYKFQPPEVSIKAGDTYTVTFTRKLAGNAVLAPGKAVPFGIAIHADNAGGRFHHVSFGHTIGLGADGDVKAAKQ